jgi:hypothetical protein
MRTRAGVDGSSAVAVSAPGPLGLALLDEGLGAFDTVLGGSQERREVVLEPDGVGERETESAMASGFWGFWGFLGRPASEYGRLCHGDGAHDGGARSRRGLSCPSSQPADSAHTLGLLPAG